MRKKILKLVFFQITFFVVIASVVATYLKFYGIDMALGPYFMWIVAVDIVLGIGIFGWSIWDEVKKPKKRG